jgi:hypothetical protein
VLLSLGKFEPITEFFKKSFSGTPTSNYAGKIISYGLELTAGVLDCLLEGLL